MEGEVGKSDVEADDKGWIMVGRRHRQRGGRKSQARGKGSRGGCGVPDREGGQTGHGGTQRSGDGDGANEARSPPTVTPQAASAGGGGGGGDGRNRK